MNIPEKAVEAALEAEYRWRKDPSHPSRVEYMLEAAAPFIAAQALRDAVADLEPYNGRARVPGDEFRGGIDYAQEALTDRANELDPQ